MSRSEFDVPVGNYLRVGIIALTCLILGCYMLIKASIQAPVPPLEALQQVTGTVQMETKVTRTRRSTREHPVLAINNQRFEYLGWFPHSDELPDLVRSGEFITIWTDAAANNWVWQIERNGEQIVSYGEVRTAVVAQRQWEPFVGIGVLVLGFLAAGRLAYVTRPLWMPDPPVRDEVVKVKRKKKRVKTRLRPLDEA